VDQQTEGFGMSWSNLNRRKAVAHDKFSVEGAVDYFRECQLEAVHVRGPCPHCHAESLEFHSVDVDDRIELRIGGYRMALCVECASFCVIFAPVAAEKSILKTGLLTRRKRTPEEIKNDKQYFEMLKKWYTTNGWRWS
jgi:hypothetical protein